jgi:hypothetical protein
MAWRLASLLLATSLVTAAGCLPTNGASSGPTPVPEPPQVRLLVGRGVQVDGHGSTQTDEISPDYASGLSVGIDVVTLTHDGHSSFIVTATQGAQTENVTSAIGAYTGQRPLVVEGPVSFQVTADGAWSLTVKPMARDGAPAFSGTGDDVSAYFTPPDPIGWNMSHNGQSAFFVYAHCLGGSIVVADKSGAVNDSVNVQFPRGPCFWEVRADGAWRLEPQ